MQNGHPYSGVWRYYKSQELRPDGISPSDAFYLSSIESLVGIVLPVAVDEDRFNVRDSASVHAELDAIVCASSETPCGLVDGTMVEIVLLDIHADSTAPADSPSPQWYADTALRYLGERLIDVDALICGLPAVKGTVRLALLTPWGLARMAILCDERVPGTDWCSALVPFVTVSAARRSTMRSQSLVANPVTLTTLAAFPLPYLDRSWMADVHAISRGTFQRDMESLLCDMRGRSRANPYADEEELVRHLIDEDNLDVFDSNGDAIMKDAVDSSSSYSNVVSLFPEEHAAVRGFNIHVTRTNGATIRVDITQTLLQNLLSLSTTAASTALYSEGMNQSINPSACIGTAYQLVLWMRFLWQYIATLSVSPIDVKVEMGMDASVHTQLGACMVSMLSAMSRALYVRDTERSIIVAAPRVTWDF